MENKHISENDKALISQQTIQCPRSMAFPDTLSPLSRYTQRRFIIIEILQSFSFAVLGFSIFIISKKFDGSDQQIIILTNGPHLLFLFSYFTSVLMAGRSKAPFLIIAGILSQLVLILCLWVGTSFTFTAILCCAFLGAPIYVPAINAIIQRNIRPQHRGRVNGTITLWRVLALTLCTLLIGNALHDDDDNFYWLFPAAGIIGFIAYYIAARTRIRLKKNTNNSRRLRAAMQDLLSILRHNKPFMHFEIAFFIYGIGFMICFPTNMIVLTNVLHISYQEYAVGIVVCSSLCIAICAPLGGLLFDRLGPTRSSSFTFTALIAHPMLMLIALHTGLAIYAYAAYAAFGIAIAGINASWVNGPTYYARSEDSAVYMGIHLSSVGLRACVGTAFVLYGTNVGDASNPFISHQGIYYITIALFLISAVYMHFLKAPPSQALK